MKGQPNRLIHDGQHLLSGTAIDRSQPLRFRLNGMTISGFAGDTVLSAALAAGIDTVGDLRGWPLALSPQFAPAIVPIANRKAALHPLPMARTPATNDADYRTLGTTRAGLMTRLSGRLGRMQRSLLLDLDRTEGVDRPWLATPVADTHKCELIVIGGGVAGLSAALAGAKAGLSVILLEASPQTGGVSRLFGTQDGEVPPDQAIAELKDAVARTNAIAVWPNAEAFALRQGVVRAHVMDMDEGAARSRVLDFTAERIVVATGAIERLPVFPGNRLPGVTGAAEAHALAHNYGVWIGKSAALATVSNPAYRLMMLVRDAGIAVPRILDGRTDPQSRFIAFAKAYGITMVGGTIPGAVRHAPKGRGIVLTPRLSLGGFTRDEAQLAVDRLIVCGGWQPDLTLWHMAGGQSEWSASHSRIEPRGALDGIALAGSAASLITLKACLASGAHAVDLLLGRQPAAVTDVLIDPLYETPDGAAQLAKRNDSQPPAYFGSGHSLLERPAETAETWPGWVPRLRRKRAWQLAEAPHPLEITDITAGVQLGAIPAASAAIVAQERVAMVTLSAPALAEPATHQAPSSPLPTYLAGRMGGNGQLWAITPLQPRILDTGSLIYASADQSDPLLAVGVVIRALDGAALALINAAFATSQTQASLRDQGRSFSVRLVAAYRPGMDLAAALSGSTSPS